MSKKIALIHNLNRGNSEHEVDFDLPVTIDALTNAIGQEYECEPVEADENAARWISQLIAAKADLVFNVAEGYRGAAREAFYPALFEQLGIPYTGPGPTELLITHNKALTKELLKPHLIPMSWGRLITDINDFDALKLEAIPFPVIVKLNAEGSSKGMDDGCICKDLGQLENQVKKLLRNYESSIIIEKFIPGRDVSITYVEGLGTFGPVEYTSPDHQIYDQRLKDIENHKIEVVTDVALKPKTKQVLHTLTQKVVQALDINGYCRIDYRIDPEEKPYLLEVNGQVCFHPDGAFVKATFENGYTYDTIVHHIIQRAFHVRRRMSRAGVTIY